MLTGRDGRFAIGAGDEKLKPGPAWRFNPLWAMQGDLAVADRNFRRVSFGGWGRFVPLAVVLAGLSAGYAFGLHEQFSLQALAESRAEFAAAVAARPVSAGLGFVAVYAIATAFAFPAASVLTILGGFIFGWLAGGLLTVAGATLGATAIFLAARTALSDVLARLAGPRIARLGAGFEHDAFTYLLVLRLAPIFPFQIVNIAPAFFNVRIATFVAATAIGIVPGTFAYSYLGEGLGSVVNAAAAAGRSVSPADLVTPQITAAFFVLALVASIPLIVRKWRAARGDKMLGPPPSRAVGRSGRM